MCVCIYIYTYIRTCIFMRIIHVYLCGIDTAALFLEEGSAVVSVVNKDGLQDAFKAEKEGVDTENPLFVLVNENTVCVCVCVRARVCVFVCMLAALRFDVNIQHLLPALEYSVADIFSILHSVYRDVAAAWRRKACVSTRVLQALMRQRKRPARRQCR